ncbi:DUF4431 domain-containing protein [Ursidibacter maritimus]|uniref:DUF4431 domain-containing protein n=1 Tax=Ursidibacter maritimus TaxID=1331689 RepID=UPI001C47E24A|nr:DUF4431 domain-containing protein [Ursidibacter maritimus]MBV6540733.1 DUF4431 domain-containing protein [Ursidibacter maritimus]
MKKLLVSLFLLGSFSTVSFAMNPSKVEYDTPVTLQGTIQKENGYPMLLLTKPISTVLGADSDGTYNPVERAQKIQIVWTKEKLPLGCVEVKGQLFGAHTAHHKTDVLIELESYKKCK